MTKEECYRLGNITKPFGIKGQMVFYLDVDSPDDYADLDSAFVEVKGALVPYFFKVDNINGNKAVVTFEDLTPQEAIELYDEYMKKTVDLLLAKNHDYDEAWRSMRTTSYTDLILMKLYRTKQIEDHQNKTLISEGIEANYMDMVNYALFGLIKIDFKE